MALVDRRVLERVRRRGEIRYEIADPTVFDLFSHAYDALRERLEHHEPTVGAAATAK